MHNTFDLYNIFFGSYSFAILAEILFRVCFMYFYTFLNFRFILKKHTLSQMNAFQFILVIALVSAVVDPMFYRKVPLIHCMLIITFIILLERVISFLTEKSSFLDKIFEGYHKPIIIDGKIEQNALAEQEISFDD